MQVIRYILFPFSLIYGLITAFRNGLYNRNILRSSSFDLPVISIGNLSTGGTGKSPHTEYLIRLLKDKYKVATLSRGYGRSKSGFHLVGKESTVRECGDEPLQFKSKFPSVQVAVEADRVKGVIELLGEAPDTELLLLDDAYQHRAIEPSYSILLTQYHKPYFKDWMLPTGNLREWPIGKKRANTVIVTKCPSNLSLEKMKNFKSKLGLRDDQSIYFSKFEYGEIRALHGDSAYKSLDEIIDLDVLLVTGIANTVPLEEKLEQSGVRFKHQKYADHHRFKPTDIDKIRNLFDTLADRKIILTTEKDAQRLKSIEETKNLPIFYIQIEVKLIEDEAQFNQEILEHVRNY